MIQGNMQVWVDVWNLQNIFFSEKDNIYEICRKTDGLLSGSEIQAF